MGQKIVTLLFAGTINVGIFIIIYQALQSVIEVVTFKDISIFMSTNILTGAL